MVILEAKSGLQAKTAWDIRMVHELVLLHCKIAIDGQSPIYFVDEGILGICSSSQLRATLEDAPLRTLKTDQE